MPEPGVTSAELVSAINKGDKNSEALFVQKYARTLLYLLEKRTGDPDLAKDICQEALLVLLKKFRERTLAEPEKLSAYVHSTAINILIASRRKEARRGTYPNMEIIEQHMDAAPSQSNELELMQFRKTVRQSILELKNERDRQILYRYYIDEQEKDLICAELDIDFRHFDKVIYRAKNRLKESIQSGDNSELEAYIHANR